MHATDSRRDGTHDPHHDDDDEQENESDGKEESESDEPVSQNEHDGGSENEETETENENGTDAHPDLLRRRREQPSSYIEGLRGGMDSVSSEWRVGTRTTQHTDISDTSDTQKTGSKHTETYGTVPASEKK